MYLDIDFFAHTVLRSTVFDESPAFHREIYHYLERSDIQKLGIICPRGHAKSTLASKIYPLHRICFSELTDTKFIILISESLDQSINLLREIRDELTFNESIRYFFGDLSGESVGNKWTESDIITANQVRVWARGSRQRIRGSKHMNRRPDLIILDDFESELNTETPEQRDKLKRWINGAVLPAPEPSSGKVFLIGTIVHEDAYLADIKNDDNNDMGWYKRVYKAGLPERDPLWPARYPLDKLEKLRKELAFQGYEYLYYQEYENEAIAPGTGLVSRDKIKVEENEIKWSEEQESWFMHVEDDWINFNAYYGLDPSRGTMKGDATGEIILACRSDGKYSILSVENLRLQTFDLINRIFSQIKNWHCKNLNLETVVFQEILRDIIYQEQPKRKQFFGINEFKPRDSKGIRLQGLQPYYYGGNISHNGVYPELVQQLITFPKSKHDDLLDALWMALQGAFKPAPIEYDPSMKKGKGKLIRHRTYNWAVL